MDAPGFAKSLAARWEPLSEAEGILFELVGAGEPLVVQGTQSEGRPDLRLDLLFDLLSADRAQEFLSTDKVVIKSCRLLVPAHPPQNLIAFELAFERCEIAGDLELDHCSFKALTFDSCQGAILSARSATISRNLTIEDCEFDSLYLYNIAVDGSTKIRVNALRIIANYARIGGFLVLHLTSARPPDTSAKRRLSSGIGLEGSKLRSAHISGRHIDFIMATKCSVEHDLTIMLTELTDMSPEWNGISLKGTQIGGELMLREIDMAPLSHLDLSNASAQKFSDEVLCWLDTDFISLTGFSFADLDEIDSRYDTPGYKDDGLIAKLAKRESTVRNRKFGVLTKVFAHVFRSGEAAWPDDFCKRMSWASRQPPGSFSLRPYRQYSDRLVSRGKSSLAREALMTGAAEANRRRRLGRMQKFGQWLLQMTAGYGYAPGRSLLWIAAMLVAGAVTFQFAFAAGHLVVERGTADPPTQFNAIAYAADVFLPILDFRQEGYWIASGKGPAGFAVQIFSWMYSLLGWALASLALAAYSGLLKRSD